MAGESLQIVLFFHYNKLAFTYRHFASICSLHEFGTERNIMYCVHIYRLHLSDSERPTFHITPIFHCVYNAAIFLLLLV